jgi:two-component system chemotaxis response regulator CheB
VISVVVVDDSALARKLIARMLESDPEIKVVGTAMNGMFALRRIYRDKPDVVTMDFEMPQMDGLQTLETLMERHPVPVVMLSAHTQEGMRLTMKALELGAVDFVQKPHGRESEVLGDLRKELVAKVKAAARARMHEIPPTRATKSPPPTADEEPSPAETKPAERSVESASHGSTSSVGAVSLIAVGSSTGGVPGVANILSALPANAPPTLVVQHMPATFTASLAARLDRRCRVTVKEAAGGEVLKPGLALIARGDSHLSVKREGEDLVAVLSLGAKVSGHRPSVDVLFESCAREAGRRCVGVILTGMGKDGARGLLAMRKAGCCTVAESEESCVVFGMPKEAIKLGAAAAVLGTDHIPTRVIELLFRGAGGV